MQGFKVSSVQDLSDWHALVREACARAQHNASNGPVSQRWLPAALWVAMVAIIAVVQSTWPHFFSFSSLLAALGLFVGSLWIFGWRRRRGMLPAKDGAFMGLTEFTFEPEGFEAIRANSHTRNDWRLVREVSQTATHIYLWIDHSSAYSVRIANIPAPLTADEAVARIRSFMAAVAAKPDGESTVLPEPASGTESGLAAASEAAPRAIPTVMQELLALLRLEFHRPIEPAHLHGRDTTLLLLALCALGLWIGLDRLNYGEGAQFMWFALPGVSAMVLFALVLAWTMARLSSPSVPMRRSLLLVLACAPIAVGATFIGQHIGTAGYYAIAIVAGFWIGSLIHSGLRVITGLRQVRAIFAACFVAAALVVLTSHFFVAQGLWYEPDPDYDPSSESSAAREQLLFEQGTRIDADIVNMAPSDAQQASNYFIGFAGYGEQRVFAQEITTAADTFAARYSTGNRQLLLVNDQRDEEKYPLASVSALRHALLGIGKRMNKERDVLFLALSSHGSENATISVNNHSIMYWRDLSAAELRAMLDEAGIRWRVIVISACHSGSFIEALANDQTIVLTAAAKENTSFGCSDDRDLTYFGEAFYRDSMPEAASLREAFESARRALEDREKAERRKPSDPQAHFGPMMEARLEEPGTNLRAVR